MIRRRFLCAAAALAAAPRAFAQSKVWRVGVLVPGVPGQPVQGVGSPGGSPTALRQAFLDLGYVEGRNLVIVVRSADGMLDRLPKLAAELVDLRVDVVVSNGSEASRAAKQATSSVPVVFSGPSYPVEEGLVQSFARPGGNVTGITAAMSDTVLKHLQLLRDVTPARSSVAVVWSPSNAGHTFAWRDTQSAAAAMGLHAVSVPLSGPDDIDAAFAAIEQTRPGALIVQPAPWVFLQLQRIVGLTIKMRMPSISINRNFAEQGLLMCYGADLRNFPRRVAAYADRIFRGAKPADLPVERPTNFELVINMTTARALDLAIPPSVLSRANEKIES